MNNESDSSAKCVLIIEDDEDIRDLVSEAFQSAGDQVITCENGQVALDYLLSNKAAKLPSLILIDLLMPVLSGSEFIEIIMKKHPHLAKLPIIITSGKEVTGLEGKLPQNFATVQKPIDIDELVAFATKHFNQFR